MTMNSPDQTFWDGKRVLVTGHTGFKGGWLSLWLHELGAKVFGLSLEPDDESYYRAVGLQEFVEDFFFDISNEAHVQRVLKEVKPDIVLHLAAQPLVIDSYLDPVGTYRTNVMGTLHLLEASRKEASVKAFLNITTDKCYENKSWFWGYRENDPLGGHDPYSSSKACSEILTSSYRRSFLGPKSDESSMALGSVRAGNVFGGGDWAKHRLIPDVARAASKGEQVLIRHPYSTRPWQFVLEPLRVYLKLAEGLLKKPETFSKAWNIGPEDHDVVSVECLVSHFCKHWGKTASYKVDPPKEAVHEQSQLKLDSSQLKALLRWSPFLSLEDGLKRTSHWYKAFYDGTLKQREMLDLSLEQIREFQESPSFVFEKRQERPRDERDLGAS